MALMDILRLAGGMGGGGNTADQFAELADEWRGLRASVDAQLAEQRRTNELLEQLVQLASASSATLPPPSEIATAKATRNGR